MGWAMIVAGCGASAPVASSPSGPTPVASAEAPATFEGTRWGTFHSKRFELSLGLPDGSSWKIDDHRSPWMRADHEATHSTILLRSWSEGENVTRKACYARAREWAPSLPDLESLSLIDDGTRKLVGDKDARVAVGVVPAAPGASTGGFVVAVVGSVRRCIVLAFQTETSGPTAADEVAGSLALIADRLLPSLKLDQSFAPSREPLMVR